MAMSHPDSPAIMAASESSSAASTPSKPASEPATILTPRSRVKQYMAQFDESDSDLETASPKQDGYAQNLKIHASRKPTSASSRESSASDGDDEQPVSRPRGRMAARMLQTGKETIQDANNASEDSQSDGQGAYARIRKQLMGKKDSSHNSGHESKKNQVPHDADIDVEDEESPIKPAKRIIRRNITASRSGSPLSSASKGRASKSPSPGLFVSPAKSNQSPLRNNAGGNSSGSEPDMSPSRPSKKNKAFQELVARKRAELREKQAKQKKERSQKQVQLSGSEDDDVDTSKLTQKPRPLRKASKKAIEEMNRETQRISRNMQLAHQARTKKTFKTSDLFARFNFKPNSANGEPTTEASATSAHGSSDVEAGKEKDTPPTSPPSVGTTPEGNKTATTSNGVEIVANEEEGDELPDIGIVSHQVKSDKGKGKAREIRPAPPKEILLDSSDDELEILPKEKSRFPVFDKVPAKRAREEPSLVRLRALAHLNSPSKSRPKSANAMTNNELQALMRRQASRQAKAERQERIDELKAKGIFIETAEEREREQLETENLLEKARQEADELRKAEKAKARREGKESADEGALSASDGEEDEDWNEEADVELSGSEEEKAGEDDSNEEEEEEGNANPLLDDAAEQSEGEEEETNAQSEAIANDAEESDQDIPRIPVPGHRNRGNRVVVDDEDEDEEEAPTQYAARPSTPTALVDDDVPDLGLGPPSSAPLGLTQMFAGSMAEDDNDYTGSILQKKVPASLDFLRQAPSTIPDYDKFEIVEQSPASMIQDTQISPAKSTQLATPFKLFSATQTSEVPFPTQDEGFLKPAVPALLHSTSDTIETLPVGVPESPIVAKKGRLQRRKRNVSILSDAEEENNSADDEAYSDIEAPISNKNAFNTMLKSSKKKAAKEAFDKKNSKAREIIEEQAEESEDEYAGLGGASDDESGDEMDQEIAAMIDDQGNFNGDERKLAAFYADKERADNERAVDKLYHDIATGGLRRKRNGADLDLSDSEDEAEERRRRRKQREFARMRKALLADEKVGQIADNVKKAAFMRAIEDLEDESDLEIEEPAVSVPDSQDTTESQRMIEPEGKGIKRNSPMDGNDENAAPARKHPRRSAPDPERKPTTLAQVRETLSFLNEESFVADSQPGPSSNAEDEQFGDTEAQPHENRFPRPSESIIPRTMSSGGSSFVDRLQQRRSAASAAAVDGAGNSAMAFQSASATTFRPPSLLKRATGLSTASSSSSVSMSGGVGDTGHTVRMGGSKKSSIHYQAREAERKSKVHKVERRRDEKLKKAAKAAGKGGLLGALGRGGFE